jgi:predicted DNA repair protein MutK
MTIGVYGLVAGIVKLDDLGLHLNQQAAAWKQSLGRGILAAAPWLMKTLSVVGTAAMFLVGGGILVHGIPALGHGIEAFAATLGWIGSLAASLAGALAGLVAGGVVLALVSLGKRLRGGGAASA